MKNPYMIGHEELVIIGRVMGAMLLRGLPEVVGFRISPTSD